MKWITKNNLKRTDCKSRRVRINTTKRVNLKTIELSKTINNLRGQA